MKPTTQKREAYFLEYAEKVRNLIDTPLVVTGGFRSADGMTTALKSGATDFIGLARPLAIDPELPNKLMADDSHSIELRPLTTGIKLIDKMALLDITWYEFQLARMAQKKKPNPNMSEWGTFFKTLAGAGVYAFRKRRA